MAAYSDATLDSYVASGAPLDKAGAYAIQDLGGALVENFAGSYTNVVGLPVEETRGLLAELGVPVSEPAGPGSPSEGAPGEASLRGAGSSGLRAGAGGR